MCLLADVQTIGINCSSRTSELAVLFQLQLDRVENKMFLCEFCFFLIFATLINQ